MESPLSKPTENQPLKQETRREGFFFVAQKLTNEAWKVAALSKWIKHKSCGEPFFIIATLSQGTYYSY